LAVTKPHAIPRATNAVRIFSILSVLLSHDQIPTARRRDEVVVLAGLLPEAAKVMVVACLGDGCVLSVEKGSVNSIDNSPAEVARAREA